MFIKHQRKVQPRYLSIDIKYSNSTKTEEITYNITNHTAYLDPFMHHPHCGTIELYNVRMSISDVQFPNSRKIYL